MRDVLTIAALTLREAQRRRIFAVAILLSVAFVGLYALGFYQIHREIVRQTGQSNIATNAACNFTIIAGFYVVSFLGVVVGVLLAVGSLSGEVASHTIQPLAARPIARSALVLGKWTGLMVLVAAFVALLFCGLIGATRAVSGYVPPNWARGMALLILQAAVMLSLSILASTRLSTVGSGVLAFLLYGLAFVGGWMEQIGGLAGSQVAVDIGITSSLIVPSEAMWKMAAYIMQPMAMHSFLATPFSIANPPSPAMLYYTLGYVILVILAAIRSFGTRDL